MAPRKKAPIRAEAMGIQFTIEPDVFDNLELLDMLDDIQGGDVLKVGKALKVVFGEQWPSIADQLRNDEGVITTSAASEFFVEAMKAVPAAKN